jgi:hypothetical protein
MNEIIDARHFLIPKKVDYVKTAEISGYLYQFQQTYWTQLRDNGWCFYAVNQRRGMCYYDSKVITIPVWVFAKATSMIVWYISHEMAHAFNDRRNQSHGIEFMRWLQLICPSDCIHHELSYKPRLACAAGILDTSEI